jgi:microcin C transport system substrate-binding protein
LQRAVANPFDPADPQPSSVADVDVQTIDWQHGYAFLKPLELRSDFHSFRYVNPRAPKGGEMRLAEMGTWYNFNPVSVRGRDAQGLQWWTTLNLLYDKLLERAADEPTAFYGRLAELVAVAEDGTWIAFRLRPEARWHDGRPITSEDLEFSFYVYRHQSGPTIRTPMSAFDRIEVLGPTKCGIGSARAMRATGCCQSGSATYRCCPSTTGRTATSPRLP